MAFGSLKNHVVNDFVDPMFDLGRKLMALSFKEKMEYWQGNEGGSFGWINVALNSFELF